MTKCQKRTIVEYVKKSFQRSKPIIETGIARQLDAVGRITLPKELRKSLGFKDRELLEIYTEDDKIILRKCERQKQDIFTGSEEDLIEYKGKLVSKESIRELSKLAGLI